MELKLISYDQAKALKELGFPQIFDNTERYYYVNKINEDSSEDDYIGRPVSDMNHEDGWSTERFNYRGYISAPELELTADWLRNRKYIHIEINMEIEAGDYYKGYGYTATIIQNFHTKDFKYFYTPVFPDKNSALSAAIDKAINILTEHNNNEISESNQSNQ